MVQRIFWLEIRFNGLYSTVLQDQAETGGITYLVFSVVNKGARSFL